MQNKSDFRVTIQCLNVLTICICPIRELKHCKGLNICTLLLLRNGSDEALAFFPGTKFRQIFFILMKKSSCFLKPCYSVFTPCDSVVNKNHKNKSDFRVTIERLNILTLCIYPLYELKHCKGLNICTLLLLQDGSDGSHGVFPRYKLIKNY